MNIEDSKNINTGTIDVEGNVIIGDGNTIINLKEAFEYKELQSQLQVLNERFEKTQTRIENYPESEEFKLELLEISNNQNKIKKKIEELRAAVIKLAEDFARIPINTERLRLAKEHFEKGEFDRARAILDVEEMTTELDALKTDQKNLAEKTKDNQQKLEDKANEFLILARLTAVDFSISNRFEKTKFYFEQSLSAQENVKNLFAYAYFLQEHRQLTDALSLYKKVLLIYRELAQANPQAYLPNVATTLNNLGILYRAINDLEAAREAYQEALQIRRELAQANPQAYLPNVAMTLNNLGILYRAINDLEAAREAYQEALQAYRELAQANPQAYLPNVATTLNNLGVLHKNINDLEAAREAYQEALQTYRELAQANPQAYLPDVAMTLNNLGNLLADTNDLEAAREAYQEALQTYKELAQANPQAYLPDVAMTLNNLGILYRAINDLEAAREAYQEALQIRRELAHANPQAYLPNVAMTAMNMSIFYFQAIPDKPKSLSYAKETITCAYPFSGILPSAKKYIEIALKVVQRWEMDSDKFLEDAIKELE